MVIVCPECSTKFRVNPERIPDAGAKVRCARCKHVFLAEKPIPEEQPAKMSPEPETSFEQPAEEPPAFPAEAISEETTAEEPFVPSPEAEEDRFSYDQFRDLDTTKPDDEDFTFGTEEETEEVPVATPSSDFDQEVFSEDQEEEAFSFSGPEDDSAAEQPTITTADKAEATAVEDEAKASDPEAQEKIASIFAADEPATKPEPAKAAAAVAVQKSSPSTSIIRILLLLILGLVIIGGALYFINGPEQIEQAIQQIIGQQTHPMESGKIALTKLEGKFINNQGAGELFVIRGEATNNFKEARAGIQVKGVIFDQNGKPLLQKTIFCGNPINDQELQTLPFSKLEEMMRNQFGKSLDNMKVNSKETIPFVIAFRDLPKTLSEFSVDVTSSEPANK